MPLSGAFYSTSYSLKPNHFREENPKPKLAEVDSTTLRAILHDTNTQAILSSSEFATNTSPDTPTNSLLISLFSQHRLMKILRYGIAYVRDISGVHKHIIRYPQFFAMCAIEEQLYNYENLKPSAITKTQTPVHDPLPRKRGIIWHTQGSGKTALSFYCLRMIQDFYQTISTPAKFYFITDRLDLLNQSCLEFSKRGLAVKKIESKRDFINELSSLKCHNTHGKDEMIVVNIQKFSKEALQLPNTYNLNFQRIFFIDEAHRSYRHNGAFYTHLFSVDKEAIFIALTGTPLLGDTGITTDTNSSTPKLSSKVIFGPYIHKYYYNSSIQDGYTLRLIKEQIQSNYKSHSALQKAMQNARTAQRDDIANLQIQQGLLDPSDIYAHHNFTIPLYDYIHTDFLHSQARLGDSSIGAMVVCQSSKQARALYAIAKEDTTFRSALILHDEPDIAEQVASFKNGELDILFVYNMLLTGFDAPRLKKLYLCRAIKEHNLLQTLTRVNRPYKEHRYGYVVDFADIDKEFDKTNKAYWDELNSELGQESEHYSRLFKTQEEIESELESIQESLFHFNTNNIEVFRKQIESLSKDELHEIQNALQNAKELFNTITLQNFSELRTKLDFHTFTHLLKVLEDRLQFVRTQELLQDPPPPQELLNLALEDYIFTFAKVGERELQLLDGLKDTIAQVRHAFARNKDQQDAHFITLYEELQRLLAKRNINPTQEEIITLDNEYKALQQRIQAHNAADDRLCNKYNDDEKFLRIHKRIRELYPDMRDSTIHTSLEAIKHICDTMIYNNKNTLENQKFFTQSIIQSTKENLRTLLDTHHSQATRANLIELITDEYLHQHSSA